VDVRTGRPLRISPDFRPVLLIFLSGAECPLCLDESATWERLAEQERRHLRVIGVFAGTTSQDVDAYVRTRNPGFEMYRLADNDELARLYNRPLKVLLDRWGRVRCAWGPSNSPVGHQALQREVLHELGG